MGKTRNTFIDVPERQMLHIPFYMQILIGWFSCLFKKEYTWKPESCEENMTGLP